MKKILFVEDDALIARIYSQKLAENGFEVVVAEDGLEAVRKLPEFRPDLVVLDLLMPRMTGGDVLKFIRRHPDLKRTHVIVFSNSFLSNLVEQIASMGVDLALVKAAVTPMQLVEAINKTLENPSLHDPPSEMTDTPAPDSGRIAPAPPSEVTTPVVVVETVAAIPRESDAEFVTRVGKEFIERVPAIFKDLRQICREFLEAARSEREADRLLALNRKLGFLTQIAGMAAYHQTAELSSALEALLFELIHKPETVTDSSRQTIAFTIAFLADRFDRGEYKDKKIPSSANILVIDDDAVSNLAVVQSLSRARLWAVSVTDPFQALEKLGQTPYDAVLMDISMPGIDGLALCEQMRALPSHRRTPVIFVTGLADFNTHARSILSGGNDLIIKPISPNELCVKVITHLLKDH